MITQNFLLIAWRYLFTKQKNSTIKYMSYICFLGIFLATFSLSFVMSIMHGFEEATYQAMQNIYPDLIIDAHEDFFDMEQMQTILQEPQYHVSAFSPHRISQGMLHNPEEETPPTVIQIKGINTNLEKETSNLYKAILNKKNLCQAVQNNNILIGKKVAQSLHVLPGEKITLLYSESNDASSMKLQETNLIVGAIFETGIDEYDHSLAYCSTECFKSILPENEVSQIHIKLKDISYEQKTKQLIKKNLGVDVYSWKDLYPALISAMQLESLGMLLILLIIVLIATINVMSILFMYIHHKQKDIALFICMGLAQEKIKKIFLSISIFLTIIATCFGIICSYLVGLFLQAYPIIKLPENIYYSSHLPLHHSFYVDISILLATLSISYAASLIPLQKISKMNITMLIKGE